MTRPLQHHFVTRAYLDNFADNDGRLHVYERTKKESFVLTPEKAARQRNYYSIRRKDGTFDDSVEHFLDQKVESPAMSVIRKLITSTEQPTWEDRYALGRWIAFQEHRTPLQRGGIEEIVGKMLKRTMEMMAASPGVIEHALEELKKQGQDFGVSADELRKNIEQDGFEIEVSPLFSLDAMLLAEDFVPYVAGMNWTVCTAADGVPFVTSDHPVIRHDPDEKSPYRFGFASPTIEFGLPLNKSQFLLINRDAQREQEFVKLKQSGKHKEADEFRLKLPEMKTKSLDVDTTWALKEGIIRSAPRFVFAPDENTKYVEFLSKEPWTVRLQVG